MVPPLFLLLAPRFTVHLGLMSGQVQNLRNKPLVSSCMVLRCCWDSELEVIGEELALPWGTVARTCVLFCPIFL